MRKKHISSLLLLLPGFIPLSVTAQDMALEVKGASGGDVSSNGFSLSWTVGEMSVQPAAQGTVYLGPGFQQARSPQITVGVFEQLTSSVEIRVWPNPAGEWVNVASSVDGLRLSLSDVLGREVMSPVLLNGTGQIPMNNLPAGMYLLQVWDDQEQLAGTVKIQHVNQ